VADLTRDPSRPTNAGCRDLGTVEAVCAWTLDARDGYWTGTCGVSWSIPEGAPSENGMNYCPRCGARLETQQPKEFT
jgi:hypothetical protein